METKDTEADNDVEQVIPTEDNGMESPEVPYGNKTDSENTQDATLIPEAARQEPQRSTRVRKEPDTDRYETD